MSVHVCLSRRRDVDQYFLDRTWLLRLDRDALAVVNRIKYIGLCLG